MNKNALEFVIKIPDVFDMREKYRQTDVIS